MGLLVFLFAVTGNSNAQNTDSLQADGVQKTGYLKISVSDIEKFHVVLNNRFEDAKEVASGDSIEIEAGRHHYRIVKQYYMDVQRFVNIEADSVFHVSTRLLSSRGNELLSRRSSYPRLFWESENFILTDPETDIYVNGEYAGTHYATVDTAGSFDVRMSHPSGREATAQFTPAGGVPFNFFENHLKPSKSKARYLSFIPGGSQFYKKQPLKAIAFLAATVGTAALAYSAENRYQNRISDFNRLSREYKAAGNPQEAYLLGNEAEGAFNESVSIAKTRNRIIYGTALIYLTNIVDGFLAPSIGFRDNSRTIDPYLDFDPAYKQPMIGVKSTF
ncbi:DUF5683 domain-containing protein [Rhodohalobacter sp. 8-1]|uniref:DUF5683 domain-containing protein n=1 Tax=Rhodohalobacter sp. 8-1 TaxID=3131972 RepID=UPI0030EB42F8